MKNGAVTALAVLIFATTSVFGHSGETHEDKGVTVRPEKIAKATDFPIKVGGDFSLIDHDGNRVSNMAYQGKHMLVFFGYASCKIMCSLSLARIGKALDLLGPETEKLTPVVITVDPERDTPEVMKKSLEKYHPGIIGHTGDKDQLAVAYKAYKQTPARVENDWEGDPIISHSSYIYLMDPSGDFETLFPPILNPESMAKIIRKYLPAT